MKNKTIFMDLGHNKMCGIAGILSKKNENVAPLIGPMLSCMRTRGPDGAGVRADKRCIQSDVSKKCGISKALW